MKYWFRFHARVAVPLIGGLALLALLPGRADEKQGMPDLCQIDQTCLPTSTANLMIWFGKHGYPKLILNGATEDERNTHTVHQIMADTDARFDWGTRQESVTIGIEKYIREAGYNCDVEYRGLDYGLKHAKPPQPFNQSWLKENDEPNKGFILLLAYCQYEPQFNTFTYAWNAGHAVTLVNALPDMILIHDPAHEEDETGRKIVTPEELTSGVFHEIDRTASVSGLLLLSGSLLGAPPDAQVMLTGAVCVTMHPPDEPSAPSTPVPANGDQGTLAGITGSSNPSDPSKAPKPATSTWAMWLFDLLFSK